MAKMAITSNKRNRKLCQNWHHYTQQICTASQPVRSLRAGEGASGVSEQANCTLTITTSERFDHIAGIYSESGTMALPSVVVQEFHNIPEWSITKAYLSGDQLAERVVIHSPLRVLITGTDTSNQETPARF